MSQNTALLLPNDVETLRRRSAANSPGKVQQSVLSAFIVVAFTCSIKFNTRRPTCAFNKHGVLWTFWKCTFIVRFFLFNTIIIRTFNFIIWHCFFSNLASNYYSIDWLCHLRLYVTPAHAIMIVLAMFLIGPSNMVCFLMRYFDTHVWTLVFFCDLGVFYTDLVCGVNWVFSLLSAFWVA